MAEVRKNKKNAKYDIEEKIDKKISNEKKDSKKKTDKKTNKTSNEKRDNHKKGLWTRFRIFCHGVKSEFLKVNWPTKYNMVKYSIATIIFIIFLAIFFYIIYILFALVQTLI